MREVSCRALDVFFRESRRRKLSAEALASGTGYSIEHLRNKHERIEWSAFVVFMKNVGKLWPPEELVGLGAGFLRSPVVRSIFLPARILFSAPDLYRWAVGDKRGAGDQLFTCIKNTYVVSDVRHASLELSLPDGYAPCPEFFLVSKGVFTELPRILGLERAGVVMGPLANGVRYEITFPVEKGFFAATRRTLAWPFNARAAAKDLKDAHEALLERYEQLEEAKTRLDDLNRNLEVKVESRTAELAQTIQQLEQAQRARDQFFANINHEIRTPLSLVILSVTDLEKRLGASVDSYGRARLDAIQSSARRLLRLVDALLLLAARQEGRLKLALTRCDIVPVLRELVAAFRPAAESHGIVLSLDVPDRCVMSVDPAALDRMVTNLVSNAIKFTPTDGNIDVSVRERGDEIEIAVQDSGIGIDEEFRTRIFGRFEQGRAPVHSGSQGSGIGLSLVKDLAEAHGGTVGVESQSGRGSTFTVRLPSGAAISESIAYTSPAPEGAIVHLRALPADFGLRDAPSETREILEPTDTARATILIAEDDPDLRGQIAALLEGDYRLLLAADGLSALRLARKHLPDLLISDVGMPGMDGLELTRRFRELHGNRIAPVVLLTAYGNLGDRLKGFDAGAVDYVLKPFEPAELRARVLSQLAMRELALKLHASEKLAALGVLSSGLAHELRNPANGIVNAIEPLRELLPPELLLPDTSAGQLFRVIEDCSRQIGVLSKQLLGLRSAKELARTSEPFEAILKRALALVAPAMRNVTLRNECEFTGPVWCAGTLVTQMISNLLENGAHAAGPGGWVRVTSRLENTLFVVEITDSGSGVAPALREKIFEPFFTTKAPGVGTGLGLTMSRDIARKHDGNLLVRDGGGGSGTVFRLEIPGREPGAETRTA